MEQEIIRADRGYQLRWLLALLVMAVLGAAALGWGLPAGIAYLAAADVAQAMRAIAAVLAVLWLTLVPLGAYLLFQARRILRAGRFPPANVRVIRDTRLLTGARARRRGYLMAVFGLAAIGFGIAGAMYFPWAIHGLLREQAAEPRGVNHPGSGSYRLPVTAV